MRKKFIRKSVIWTAVIWKCLLTEHPNTIVAIKKIRGHTLLSIAQQYIFLWYSVIRTFQLSEQPSASPCSENWHSTNCTYALQISKNYSYNFLIIVLFYVLLLEPPIWHGVYFQTLHLYYSMRYLWVFVCICVMCVCICVCVYVCVFLLLGSSLI